MSIWQSSCWYTALMSLGMTLIRANTLAFGLIGKDGTHGIIKICFGNMNLVLGSEVAPLDFGNIQYVRNSRNSAASPASYCIFGDRVGRQNIICISIIRVLYSKFSLVCSEKDRVTQTASFWPFLHDFPFQGVTQECRPYRNVFLGPI